MNAPPNAEDEKIEDEEDEVEPVEEGKGTYWDDIRDASADERRREEEGWVGGWLKRGRGSWWREGGKEGGRGERRTSFEAGAFLGVFFFLSSESNLDIIC